MAKYSDNAIYCNFKSVSKVVLEDSLNHIYEGEKKYPLVVDHNGNVGIAFQYCGGNYLFAANPKHMEKDSLRRAVLGSIRYGLPLIIDMDDMDLFESVSKKMDEVHKDMMEKLITRRLIDEELYEQLIEESDGEEYKAVRFTSDVTSKFMFIVVVKGSVSLSADQLKGFLPVYVDKPN